jgi:hypothetical protein
MRGIEVRNLVRALVLSAACLACGGGQGNGTVVQTNKVVGTIGSRSFTAEDATSTAGSWKGFDFVGPSLAVQISDYAALCTYSANLQEPPNTQNLVLMLARVDASGSSSPPVTNGEFPLLTSAAAGLWSQAWYEYGGSGVSGSYDCFRAYSRSASSGKVVVTSISDDAVTGTFDLVFEPGDHVTGSFYAPTCAGADLNRSLTCP